MLTLPDYSWIYWHQLSKASCWCSVEIVKLNKVFKLWQTWFNMKQLSTKTLSLFSKPSSFTALKFLPNRFQWGRGNTFIKQNRRIIDIKNSPVSSKRILWKYCILKLCFLNFFCWYLKLNTHRTIKNNLHFTKPLQVSNHMSRRRMVNSAVVAVQSKTAFFSHPCVCNSQTPPEYRF